MIKVISSGFYSTIQDSGRAGFADIGVPISGVMDSYSAKLANHLLNNNEDDAVLEITFGNCKLSFENQSLICVSGADFSPKINGKPIALNSVLKVKKGDLLSFGNRNYGVRSYLAVLGGFKTEKIMKSRSFYKGITKNWLLKKGMLLPIQAFNKSVEKTYSSVKIKESHFQSQILECYAGPEYDFLSEKQKKELRETVFTVSKDNNRMGYQLEEIIKNNLKSMLTSGVLPGTVQLTPFGKMIVLMRNCGVTGGYPRVLQLTDYSIDKLSQKIAGDRFEFRVAKPDFKLTD